MNHLFYTILVVTLSGCVSVQHVGPTISDFHERFEGNVVQIQLLNGRRTSGRVLWIRPDSTQWVTRGGGVRTEETSKIHAFEVERRGRATARGAAYGAAVGLPLAALAYAVTKANDTAFSALGSENDSNAGTQAVGFLVSTTLVGAAVGFVVGRKQRWVINERQMGNDEGAASF